MKKPILVNLNLSNLSLIALLLVDCPMIQLVPPIYYSIREEIFSIVLCAPKLSSLPAWSLST